MAVTLEGIRLLLDQQKEQLVIEINTKFDELKADIEMVRLAAERAESLAKANQNEIDEMKSEIAKLNDANTHLNALLDDQINRNMRTTLIFKGIKEEKDEGWEQTEDRLVDVLSRHLNLNKDNLKGMIERAHRGKHSRAFFNIKTGGAIAPPSLEFAPPVSKFLTPENYPLF